MATPSALIGGRYRLVRELGRGGMSVVWEAQDERLDRVVAVKQLHIQPGLTEPEARIVAERAMREARIHARLHHPHVVSVFDVVEYENQPALVMELVPSQTLAEILRDQGPMEAGEAARIGSQVASALAAAHALGIVHRDVKPSNILIGDDGRARLSDFGISRAFGDTTLTGTGMVNGTPAYLAPEVALGNESTPAADVFSLGSTLYAALEGGPPFGTEGNAIALLHKVAQADIPTPARAGDLAPLLASMLAKDPDLRPAMADVGTTLSALTSGSAEPSTEEDTGVSTVAIAPPTGARPTAVAGAAAAGVAAGAVVGAAGASAGGVATASAGGTGIAAGGGTDTVSAARPDSPTAVLPASEADAATPRLVSPTQAAPVDSPPTDPPPPVGEPVPDQVPPNRRRGWIAGVAAVVLLLAAVALAGLLWPRAAPPGPNPNTTVVPAQTGRSEQRSESPTSDETDATETEANNPRETRATDDASETRGNEESSRGPSRESSESNDPSDKPSESSESSASSESASEPSESQSGDGDNSGDGDGEGDDDNSGEGGDG